MTAEETVHGKGYPKQLSVETKGTKNKYRFILVSQVYKLNISKLEKHLINIQFPNFLKGELSF